MQECSNRLLNPSFFRKRCDKSKSTPCDDFMNESYFTYKAQKSVDLAEAEAATTSAPETQVSHLLLGLTLEGTGLASKALKICGASLDQIRQMSAEDKSTRNDFDRLIKLAGTEAQRLQHNYIGTEHLLLAITSDQSGQYFIERIGLNTKKLRAKVLQLCGEDYRSFYDESTK